MPHCPECGIAFEGTPRFCPNCGARLSERSELIGAKPTEMSPKRSNSFRLFSGFGAFVILASMFMPWLTVNFLGQFNVSLANIYELIFRASQSLPSSGLPSSGANPQTTNQLGSYLVLATIILYPVALISATVSVASKKALVPAGILTILTGITWILGVESMKSTLVQQASQLGGVLGGTFTSVAASLITIGYGTYAIMFGGALILAGYYVTRSEKPK